MLKSMRSLFTKHPSSVGETYLQHLLQAGTFAAMLLLAACAAIIHALLPFACVTTASKLVTSLYTRMAVNRQRRLEP